ncbi:hypothetical protein BSL78_15162 [Apostichopus japonicus]|uniref:Thyroglobulin type-1 domain-containing protein n=1 Tax=Stichopus japonicus TaxID=307972 RepID=A0A2G8KIY0_STIJA|nr:hypothetical protein BSL78_15162 [Apostichopus japonicus]
MFRFAAVAICFLVISEVSAQTCLVSEITLQNDFSPQKYVGTWYIVAHIQDGVYPYQRRSHYHLNSDMTFSMATQRIVEPAGCEEPWHFEVTGWSPDATQPAKMLVRPNIENLEVEPEDYWVISTDYVNYALVYSCGQVQDDGTCDPALTHAWIMSRSGQPLDKGSNKVVANIMLNELCLHIDRITEIPTECDAQLGVPGLSSEKRYTNCITHLADILIKDDISNDSFLPRCEEGGVLYRPLQCAVDGVVCWCVEEESGKELPNTRTRLPESPPC